MIGSAAFLLPDGRMVPLSGREPSTTNCIETSASDDDGRTSREQWTSPRAEVKQLLDTPSREAYATLLTLVSPMQLLVAVINHVEQVDDILAGFVELGITGATVVNSEGMGHVLTQDVPIFAGLRSLTTRSRPSNQMLLSVIEEEKVDAAIALIQEVCGSLTVPGAGIVFTLPIERVVGLAPELDA